MRFGIRENEERRRRPVNFVPPEGELQHRMAGFTVAPMRLEFGEQQSKQGHPTCMAGGLPEVRHSGLPGHPPIPRVTRAFLHLEAGLNRSRCHDTWCTGLGDA